MGCEGKGKKIVQGKEKRVWESTDIQSTVHMKQTTEYGIRPSNLLLISETQQPIDRENIKKKKKSK